MLSFLPSVRKAAEGLPPIAPALLAIAPLHLPNRRKARYLGEDLCISLDTLADIDRTSVASLYRKLSELLSTIAEPATGDARKTEQVRLWTNRYDLDKLIDEVRALGVTSHARQASDELAMAMHDVRGGALTALLGRLQLNLYQPPPVGELNTLFVLTRDHLKIMRNAIVGLDEQRRNADRTPKSHDVRLILEKWHESVVGAKLYDRPVRLFIDCRHEGALTECCLESAAIDRIFYNLANNACRHLTGDRLDMVVFPLPEASRRCLRFVLSNPVGVEDATYLRSIMAAGGSDDVDSGIGQSLFALFAPTVSSTGSGFGLTVVAEFVASAFGLTNVQEALRERYVGAILDGDTFRAWFHWPIANSSLPPKLDDYKRPEESLSGG